jgi:hypothetical protein
MTRGCESATRRRLGILALNGRLAVWPFNSPAPMLMILRKTLRQFLLTLCSLTLPE